MSAMTSDQAVEWERLKTVFSHDNLDQIEAELMVCENTVHLAPANERAYWGRRIESCRRQLEAFRTMANLLQWEVIER